MQEHYENCCRYYQTFLDVHIPFTKLYNETEAAFLLKVAQYLNKREEGELIPQEFHEAGGVALTFLLDAFNLLDNLDTNPSPDNKITLPQFVHVWLIYQVFEAVNNFQYYPIDFIDVQLINWLEICALNCHTPGHLKSITTRFVDLYIHKTEKQHRRLEDLNYLSRDLKFGNVAEVLTPFVSCVVGDSEQ